jgi:hypothetical protein
MRPALSPAQVKAKDKYLRATYHITYEQYCRLREFQGYKCAICKEPEIKFRAGMAVDHNHKSGQVRGLLCNFCNRKLGRWFDNDEHVIAAGAYITLPPLVILFGEIITAPHKEHSPQNGENVPNENSVQDALSAQLKYEINGEELNKAHKLALQQKYGLAQMPEGELDWYLEVLSDNAH